MKFYCLILLIIISSCDSSNSIEEPKKNFIEKNEQIGTNENDTVKLNDFWKSKGISSATLYCYLPEDIRQRQHNNLILDDEFNLHETVIDSLTVDIDSNSLNYLKLKLVEETDFMEEWVASCFEPHHGIVLRDSANEIVGHFSICFECNQYRLFPEQVHYIPIHVFREICINNNIPTKRGEIMKAYYSSKK